MTEASNDPDDTVRLLIPFRGWDESHVPRIKQAVAEAYRDEFGDDPNLTSRHVEIGRGGDAGASLIEIVGVVSTVYAVFVGPSKIARQGREATRITASGAVISARSWSG